MVLTNSRRFDTGVTSQDLFKIVGIHVLSSISLLENGTNLRKSTRQLNGKFVGIPLLIYSHKAITVHKGGGVLWFCLIHAKARGIFLGLNF